MNDTICKSYFKDGKTSTTVQAYTGAWVRLGTIHQPTGTLQGSPVQHQIRRAARACFHLDETEASYVKGRHLLPPVRRGPQ